MKKITCGFLVAMVMLLASPPWVHAGGKHVRTGVYIGIGNPGWGGHHTNWRHHGYGPRSYWRTTVVLGSWYPYGYCAPGPVVVQQQPPVYVQQEQEEPQYWYYCQESQAYYPYVKSCPGGWMKVVPEAAPPQQ